MAEYIEYHPLKFWLDPASIAEIVAHIQAYLVANPINSTTEIETIIHDYLIAHPEIIGGVRSINGETGEVVLTADNISGGENVTIADVLDSLQDQIDDIVASIPSDYQQLIDDVSDLKSAKTIINDIIDIEDVEWVKGSLSSDGRTFLPNENAALSNIITKSEKITFGSNCRGVIFLYNGDTPIGKFNSSGAVDIQSGSFFYFTGDVYVQSLLMMRSNITGLRIVLFPTDDTTITDSTAETYANSKVSFDGNNKVDDDYAKTAYLQEVVDAYLPNDVYWAWTLFAANDAQPVAGNGALSNILSGINDVTLGSSCKALLLLYKDGEYIGKLNSSYQLDKVSGSWGYFTDSIPVSHYTNLYEADGIRVCVVPTDSTTLALNTVQSWAESKTTFNLITNNIDILFDTKSKFESLVYDSTTIDSFIQGGYKRDGSYDATAQALVTSTNNIPTGYDVITMADGWLGIIFAFDSNNVYYGGINSDYTLTGGYYSGTFYFTSTINIGYFQTAYPNLNYKLCIKKSDGSSITPPDATGVVTLKKYIAESVANSNNKISGLTPTGGFGYARNNFIITIGHRGGHWDFPENTLPSFLEAARRNMLYVETDVAYTSDNVPVLLHDLSINRVARNADGTEISSTVYIADITYEQALQYDFGIYRGSKFTGTKIMKFEDFINLCRELSLTPVIELKRESSSNPDIHTQERVNALFDIIDKYNMRSHVMWASFDTASMGRVLNVDKSASIAIAISPAEVSNSIALELKIGTLKAFKNGANFVCATLGISYATSAVYNLLAKNNIPVIEWYINSTSDAVALATHKTSIGGMTDYAVDIGGAIKDSLLS